VQPQSCRMGHRPKGDKQQVEGFLAGQICDVDSSVATAQVVRVEGVIVAEAPEADGSEASDSEAEPEPAAELAGDSGAAIAAGAATGGASDEERLRDAEASDSESDLQVGPLHQSCMQQSAALAF